MVKILWFLLELFDNNHGYTTPLQKRYKPGDVCKISKFKTDEVHLNVGDPVVIVETGRHDYLIETKDGRFVVYQFELEKL
jgi:hypothetical protein